MAKSTFEEVIKERGELIYTNVGDSMYPLIRPRDLLVIQTPTFPMKRYDIPLYKRDNGQYVLHRIIKVRRHDYLLCGDNREWAEDGITDRHIIGVLTAIIRNGERIPIDPSRTSVHMRIHCNQVVMRYNAVNLKRKLKSAVH